MALTTSNYYLVSGSVRRTMNGQTGFVWVVTKLLNGDLVSGSTDTTNKIWNTNDGTVKKTLTNGDYQTIKWGFNKWIVGSNY